jgi:outer membrane receptor protein involved in Fe transport
LAALLATSALIAPFAALAQDGSSSEPAAQDGGLSISTAVEDEIVVRGRFIPEPQRATSQVASFLSAEDLKRTGDDNAALALTRLSGLSVVSGKFAFVRGLGDRYSAALLNGSPLPSPEPLRRTVPLDLFPANVLAGADVQKTYSANFPGEFGGGLIDLRTVKDPGESYLKLKAGIGANLETTSREGVYYRGGDRDWLGYDDGLRDFPAPLQTLIDSRTRLDSLTPAGIEAVGESLANSPISVLQEGAIGPNFEGSVDSGLSFDLGEDMTLGLIGVVGYKQDWTTERALRQLVQGGQLGKEFNIVETTLDSTVNGLGSAALSFGEHVISATGLYIHTASKQAQQSGGFDFNAPSSTGEVSDEFSGFYERDLLFGQIAGSHVFGELDIDWRGSAAISHRDAPYERSLRRFPDANGQPIYSFANNYRILFSELEDEIISGGVKAAYRIPFTDVREAILSAGYDYSKSNRDYDFLALQFVGGNSLPLDVQQARPDFLFSPDNIDPNRFILQEIITPNDSHTGRLEVHAGFFQADVDVLPLVRATLGVRYETAEQSVVTFDRFGNLGQGAANLDNSYWLPAATVTWNFYDDMQLRLGYSHTIARPQFRELARSEYFDPESERLYRGNNGLVDSELRNYDARYEYYLGRNQFVTLGGFYKTIEKPIEEIQFSTSTFEFITTFINSPNARLFGGEFEYRTRFESPIDTPFMNDREWLFSVNYTYTNSEVQAKAGEFVFSPLSGTLLDASLLGLDGTQLQGAPEHIVNAQFGWEGDNDQFTILFGWVDDRILQRGVPLPGAELPDVIERPGIQLDAVFRQTINISDVPVTFGLSARNLLAARHREFQTSTLGETEFNTYDRGRSISASVTTEF